MNRPLIKLWTDASFYSPYAMSVYVALREKGLSFTLQPVDLAQQQQRAPEYAALSLTRRVPMLALDEMRLSESSAIVEYLEECFPAPDYKRLYPRDREKRARARELQAWLRSDFMPLRQQRPGEVLFAGKKYSPLTEDARQSAATLIEGAQRLLGAGQQNLFGEWSIADTDLAVMLNRLALHGDELPDNLAYYAWFQWQRASVQLWLAEAGKNG
ncbi:glutathione transferase [Mixta tenebrionis]|uniref:Glutathione transferase n=1 Tax=Mixta tenebrionis TaxID=2562439 RepID=A0A506VBL6_9GAMM|nr:glutathione transferase [Mixta tenebrionis]TPW42906.1 glutathione transferase [Mixta tenebrionis]